MLLLLHLERLKDNHNSIPVKCEIELREAQLHSMKLR